jgi:GNAT superfamily N-acetyltransferase
MEIQNSRLEDLAEIYSLYEIATNFQRIQNVVTWPIFERALIEYEIYNKQQWKIIINNEIACIWATTFNDPLIWGERNLEPSVYIHRIATKPKYRGKSLVRIIAEWAINYARENNKLYVRMDTVGKNEKLIKHYSDCGFHFLGLLKLVKTNGLPLHYKNATVSLFQLEVTDKMKV